MATTRSSENATAEVVSLVAVAAATTYAIDTNVDLSNWQNQLDSKSLAPLPENSSKADYIKAEKRASLFLRQATNGATRSDIDAVVTFGAKIWLDQQFAMERSKTHVQWLCEQGYDVPGQRFNLSPWDYSIWRQLIECPDQLRQKVALCLLDIFVVGIDGITSNWQSFKMAYYMDILLDNAFGNFRELLKDITYTPAMADFLTFISSSKASPTQSHPDENYARELMQLFCLGLYQINDGAEIKFDDKGNKIDAYTQDDVEGLARVFTGLRYDWSSKDARIAMISPLKINEKFNETGNCHFLGATVSGGGDSAISSALDIIFNHPNTAPFFALNMIRRLVTSNPSPEYVSRVTSSFKDNGNGVRGDISAVVKAVLLDVEARHDSFTSAEWYGKLRDPVQRFTGWARACDLKSMSGAWKIGNLSGQIGQSPGRSPSVFNFFEQAYTPPQSKFAESGMIAPEFQMANEITVLSFVDLINSVIFEGISSGDIYPTYEYLWNLRKSPTIALKKMGLLLFGESDLKFYPKNIVQYVKNMPSETDQDKRRQLDVIAFTLASSSFSAIQK